MEVSGSEEHFDITEKQFYYIIDDIKREAFMEPM
jgi:hypothetical protein